MPVNLDIVQNVISETYNSVKINRTLSDSDNYVITIFYTRYMDGEFVSKNNQHHIRGTDFTDIVMALPDPAVPRYADNKKALYSKMLLDLGLTGTIA